MIKACEKRNNTLLIDKNFIHCDFNAPLLPLRYCNLKNVVTAVTKIKKSVVKTTAKSNKHWGKEKQSFSCCNVTMHRFNNNNNLCYVTDTTHSHREWKIYCFGLKTTQYPIVLWFYVLLTRIILTSKLTTTRTNNSLVHTNVNVRFFGLTR